MTMIQTEDEREREIKIIELITSTPTLELLEFGDLPDSSVGAPLSEAKYTPSYENLKNQGGSLGSPFGSPTDPSSGFKRAL